MVTLITSTTLVGLAVSSNLSARQDSSATQDPEKKIIVTGSRIKKVDINNLTPILSISREDIDKQGFATVKDVIDGLTQNAGGTIDNSFVFGFTPAASTVNIRGIGFGHTLVLVDGRRLPIYPIGVGGTDNFVDLSSIPMAFVERVDVLTDGASAVYGSDAVSGVINVITRKEIEGISMNYRYSDTTDGGYETHRYNLLTGARNGDTQVDLIFDIWSQEALMATDRDYAATDVANPRGSYSGGGSSFIALSGNVYQDPNCGTPSDALGGEGVPDVEVSFFNPNEIWCGFDRSPYRQLIAPQDRFSLMTRLTYEINPDLTFFSRIGYSYSQTKTQLEPNFYGSGLFHTFDGVVDSNGGFVPAGAINNPTTGSALEESGFFIRRLVEFGPRRSDIENNAVNLLLGLDGSFGDGQYDWELGVAYNRTDVNADSNNVIISALHLAVDNGLNLFEPIPQNVVNSLSFTANQDSYSTNQSIDFSISGDLPFSLDAGPVQFAVALEHVSQKYKDDPDPLVLLGDAFDGRTSGGGDRKHLGLGGELSFPFSDNFEMDIALRWDDYQDDSNVNDAVSPRISMAYRPFDNLLTRLSWGRSFRAPDMQRLFGGDTQSFVDILDPEFLVDENGDPCTDAQAPNCSPTLVQSVTRLVGSNVDLKEEEGSNLSAGIVWEAREDLTFTVDYFQIELDEVVTTLSAQSIVDICSEFGELCEFISRDAQGTLFGNGAFIESDAINFAERDTRGIDLVVDYDWQNELGNWSTNFSVTWIEEHETRLFRGTRGIENVGLGILPEYRANLVVDWSSEDWGATLRMNYVDSLAGIFCFPCSRDQFSDSWLTTSVSARFDYSEFTRIRFGINNLTNEEPPEDPSQNNWPWFNNGGGYYNAIGRELYLQIDTRF